MRHIKRYVVATALAATIASSATVQQAVPSSQRTPSLYYPAPGDSWERRSPDEAGMDGKLLEEAMTYARTIETADSKNPLETITQRAAREQSGEIVGPTRERAPLNVVVLRHGYIVAEFGETLRADMSFSVAKSFVSTTVGLALDSGLIKDLGDPVSRYVKDGGYDSPHNAKITWHQSLQQTSEWEGTLWDKPDTFDRRRGRNRQLQEPGTFWEYNDVRVNRLALSSLRVWKRPLPVVLKERIMDPIGASNTWEWHGYRNSTIPINGKQIESVSGGGHWGGGMWISSRDLARFGYLFLRGGKWKGKQLTSEKWIKMATTPCDLKQDYGYMWWLNTNRTMYPGAPATGFAALGAGTNICFVDPENDLVVVVRWVNQRRLPELLTRIEDSIRRPDGK
jgi:CubicO group peptidase (beta-lactamase class C family)